MLHWGSSGIRWFIKCTGISKPASQFNFFIGVVHLEKMLGVPEKHLEFHIWYLKEKRWIERNENGGFVITANGVDEVIKDDLLLRKDRLLTFSKDFAKDFDSHVEESPGIPDFSKTQ